MKTIVCLLLYLVYYVSFGSCQCRIACRLDDIQDGWITEAQMTVINRFLENKIPLTIGIISNYFGRDPTILSFIQKVAADPTQIEVASHGVNHEDFRQFPLQQQIDLLTTSRNQIEAALPEIPSLVSFITPFDVFNDDTITAMSKTNFSIISAGIGVDPCPHPNSQPVYHFPRGASTSTEDGQLIGVPASVTLDQVQQQLQSCSGWSVIMLHPQEFSNGSGLNATMIAQLDILLPALKKTGCSLRLFKDMST